MAQDTFPELCAGFRWFLTYWVVFFLLVFGIHFSLFLHTRRHLLALPAVARGMAMAFVDDVLLPIKARH